MVDKCRHINIVKNSIYVTCIDCGLVVRTDRYVSMRSRVYDSEDVRNKVHTEVVSGIFNTRRTTFEIRNNVKDKSTFSRIKRVSNWDPGYKRKGITIKILSEKYFKHIEMDNSDIKKDVEYLILKTIDKKLSGYSNAAFAMAILIYCFRLHETPFNVRNMLSFFGDDGYVKDENNDSGKLNMKTVMKLHYGMIKEYNLKPVKAVPLHGYVRHYIYRLNNKFGGLNGSVNDILSDGYNFSNMYDSIYSGRNKLCSTAGIIYVLSDKYDWGLRQDDISEILEVTTVSLRTARDNLLNLL